MAFLDSIIRARASTAANSPSVALNVSTRSHDAAHHEAVIAWRTRAEVPAAVSLRTEHAALESEVEVVISSVDGRDELELGLELHAIEGSKRTVYAHAIERGCTDQPLAERKDAGLPGITSAQCLFREDSFPGTRNHDPTNWAAVLGAESPGLGPPGPGL